MAAPAPSPSTASVGKELEQKLFVSETTPAPPAAAAAAVVAASKEGQAAPGVDLAPVSKKGLAYPARPGAGTIGEKVMIRADHFLVDVADKNFIYYDVSINPESKSSCTNREVLSEPIKVLGKKSLGGKLPAYDGRKSLYTAGSLPFESEEFVVTLVGPEKRDKERAEREYNIIIRIAGRTELYNIQHFLAGRQRDMPQETIHVLDVVPRESPSWESFFSTMFGHRGDIGEGLECWRGYSQSLRPTQMGLSLNIDISATSFFKPVTVIQFVQEFLNLNDASRPLADRDCMKLRYHDSGREKTCSPSVGQWNMINKKMINGGTMEWACISFSRMCPEEVHRFYWDQVQMCYATGIAFCARPLLDIRTATPNNIENALRDVHRRSKEMIAEQEKENKLQLFTVILPEICCSCGKVEKVCETDLGIVSQCCLPRHASRPNKQYLENVALKINVKAGGRNTLLKRAFVRNGIPFVSKVPKITFAAAAAVVAASKEGQAAEAAPEVEHPPVSKKGLTHPAGPGVGTISEKVMIRANHFLVGFADKNLIHYDASAALVKDYLPPVACAVVQKRHLLEDHERADTTEKIGNILPGIVVDPIICHPMENDFVRLKDEETMQVKILLPRKTVTASAKKDDSLQSILSTFDLHMFDTYYTCESRVLRSDMKFSESKITNGSIITANSRLRGGTFGQTSGSSDTSVSIPRPIPLTRVPFERFIAEKKRGGKWFEVVQIPLKLRSLTDPQFAVMLDKTGRRTLKLILHAIERIHKRGRCLRGNFEQADIFFIVEHGILEVANFLERESVIDTHGYNNDKAKTADIISSVFGYSKKIQQLLLIQCMSMH